MAIHHYPTWAEAHRIESLIRGRSGDMPGAVAAVEFALMLLNRGYDQPSQFVSGKKEYVKLRRAVVLHKAATLAACERLPEAVSCLETEIREWGEHSELWHELGRLLTLSGKEEKARWPLIRAVLKNPKRYGVVAVDPQLSKFPTLVTGVLGDLRSMKLDEIETLECAWMATHGRRGIAEIPESESSETVTYGDLVSRVNCMKKLLSPDTT
jgi:hypothetical protein